MVMTNVTTSLMTAAEMQARTDLIKRLDRVIIAVREWQIEAQDRVLVAHDDMLTASRVLPFFEAAERIIAVTETSTRRLTAIIRVARLTRRIARQAYQAALESFNQ